MHSTGALSQMGFGNLLAQADAVAIAVLLLLLLMGVFSWYYIVTKALRAVHIRREADGVVAGFWEAPSLQAFMSLGDSLDLAMGPDGMRVEEETRTLHRKVLPPFEAVKKRLAEGIVVHGHVPDLAPYMDGARVAVAPLRFGAGVKGKVNLSMAHGQPVVATPCAVAFVRSASRTACGSPARSVRSGRTSRHSTSSFRSRRTRARDWQSSKPWAPASLSSHVEPRASKTSSPMGETPCG